ncbi:MAG: hypothetical protein APF84_18175 [Gracilibacter sp. BRH_c7a]|nr:MAG: hypothetical protein APF84_18175 [Gracilibacter sp. BRH_c7a]
MTILVKEGYLLDFGAWNREIAKLLAEYDNIYILSEQQWQIIFFIRDYFHDFKRIPSIFKICGATGLTTIDICRLFPRGPVRSAARIAGVPSSFCTGPPVLDNP